MVLVGIISFIIGVFSLVTSVYMHALNKKEIKGLRYFEIWKGEKGKERCFVLFNPSELYITKNDVYKDLVIKQCDEEAKLENHEVLVPFSESKIQFVKEGNAIRLDVDYICPRSFSLVKIITNSKYYLSLNGILKDGKIIKNRYGIMRFWYHPITRFMVYELCSMLIILAILLPLAFFENFKDETEFKVVVFIAFVLAILLGLFISKRYDSLNGIDMDSYKKINQIVNTMEHNERIMRRKIRKKNLLVKLRYLKRKLFVKTGSKK